MPNEEILQKMEEDMKLRDFFNENSHKNKYYNLFTIICHLCNIVELGNKLTYNKIKQLD